jgi:hypothetical protein
MSASQLITQSPLRAAIHVPMFFPPRRLLTKQAAATLQLGSLDLKTELLAHRANRTTALPPEIEGYRHAGRECVGPAR